MGSETPVAKHARLNPEAQFTLAEDDARILNMDCNDIKSLTGVAAEADRIQNAGA